MSRPIDSLFKELRKQLPYFMHNRYFIGSFWFSGRVYPRRILKTLVCDPEKRTIMNIAVAPLVRMARSTESCGYMKADYEYPPIITTDGVGTRRRIILLDGAKRVLHAHADGVEVLRVFHVDSAAILAFNQ